MATQVRWFFSQQLSSQCRRRRCKRSYFHGIAVLPITRGIITKNRRKVSTTRGSAQRLRSDEVAFEAELARAEKTFDAIIIGGAALVLLGAISRRTRDVDVLSPDIPEDVQAVAHVTAAALRGQGVTTGDDWLNNGPQGLQESLPTGWRERVVSLHQGAALHLWTLGRADLLKTKLFAYCDRGADRVDCVALRPSAVELKEALPWVTKQDAHPDWPEHVRATFQHLAPELGHGV